MCVIKKYKGLKQKKHILLEYIKFLNKKFYFYFCIFFSFYFFIKLLYFLFSFFSFFTRIENIIYKL